MGIFNIFHYCSTDCEWTFWWNVVKRIFDSQAIYALIMSGCFLLIAAISVLWVEDKVDKARNKFLFSVKRKRKFEFDI